VNSHGGHFLIWTIRGRAAGQGSFFGLAALNNGTCRKQGMILRARRLEPRIRAWLDGFLFSSSAETQQLGFRRIEHYFSDLNGLLSNINSCRTRQYVF